MCFDAGVSFGKAALQMIEVFGEPPNWDDYSPESERTLAVNQYFDLNAKLGGRTFFMVNKDGRMVHTPVKDWIHKNRNSGFYEFKNVDSQANPGHFHDFWLLTRDITEEEKARLDACLSTPCFWDVDLAPYATDSHKFLAYRRIQYTANELVAITDIVTNEF